MFGSFQTNARLGLSIYGALQPLRDVNSGGTASQPRDPPAQQQHTGQVTGEGRAEASSQGQIHTQGQSLGLGLLNTPLKEPQKELITAGK